MYTVMRFMCATAEPSALERIGGEMNVVRPGSFQGMRQRGDGFSIDVSAAASWSEHRRAIEDLLAAFAPHIAAAFKVGGSVSVDVAVEPEDHEHASRGLMLDAALLRLLTSHGVQFEVTVY